MAFWLVFLKKGSRESGWGGGPTHLLSRKCTGQRAWAGCQVVTARGTVGANKRLREFLPGERLRLRRKEGLKPGFSSFLANKWIPY
jgi:hypothetical protein